MKNKSLAWILIGMMLINLIPMDLLANNQNPVKELLVRQVAHTTDTVLADMIIPKIDIEWKKADIDSITGDPHDTQYYQFEIIDVLKNNKAYWSERLEVDIKQNSFVDNLGKYYFGANEYGNLDNNAFHITNGKLYKVGVVPRHTHVVTRPDSTVYEVVAPQTGMQEYRYVLTDFNTQMREIEGQLEVVWEYVPGATYELVYIAADKNTKGEILGSLSGDTPRVVKQITDDEAKPLLFTENGVQKVKYTLPQTKPGQIYSAYVEVIDLKNVNYPGRFNEIKRNEASDEKGPKVVKGIPAIELKITNIGRDLIELSWDNNAWAVLTDTLQRVLVYGKGISESDFKLKATKNNDLSSTIKSIIIDEPKEDTYYYIDYVFKNSKGIEYTIKSKIVLYVPYALREEPLKPKVPKPWGPNIIISQEQDKKDYLVTGDDKSITDVSFKDNTFHANIGSGTSIQLVWDIPFKKDTTGYAVEHEMLYDIWVTDDQSLLYNQQGLEPVAGDIHITENDKSNIIYTVKDKKPVGLKWRLNQYLDSTGSLKNMVSNKTYYIKIVAKRPYGEEVSISQPTIVTITIDKNGDIFAPPVLGKPPLQLEDVTTTTATIKWLESWYEILAKNPDLYQDKEEHILSEIGSSRVYLDKGAALPLRYKSLQNLEEKILLRQSDIDYVKSEVNKQETSTYDRLYYDRQVKLGKNVSYELKIVDYNEVEKQLNGQSIEEWIVEHESNSIIGWQTIKPTIDKDILGLEWKNYTVEGLKPNTRYVMMIRAYRILEDGTKEMQTFPSYIICTTLTDHESEEPIPTVPILSLERKTDTSITVWWNYNDDFDYELVYSRKDDPDQAKVWDFKISSMPGDENYIADGARASVTINGLFPETSYNIWIRAKQKEGKLVSVWSNPVRARTEALKVPAPPTGLGPAAYQSILDLGLDFRPISHDTITVEWIKHPDDIGKTVEGGLEKSYEYDLEFADNMEFLDATRITISEETIGSKQKNAEILSKNIVKFTNLVSNRPYYARINARVVIKDVESNLVIKKESEFTKWVRILTKTSDDEYDGGEQDYIVIYPSDIKEEYSRDTWTWEIINPQGIITQILNKKDYYFTVKVDLYNNKHDPGKRKVRIPKSVINALTGQNMELRIITNKGKYEIKPQVLSYYIQNAGANDIIEFELETVFAYDLFEIAKSYPYTIYRGESLSISVPTNKAYSSKMTKLDGYMKVSTKLPPEYQVAYTTLQPYTYTSSSSGWIKQPITIDQFEGNNYMSYTTPYLGIYCIYKVESQVNENLTSHEMVTIAKNYTIEDLGSKYTRYSKVYSDQYINLLLGIAKSKPSIRLDSEATEDAKRQAKVAGIYLEDTSGYVTEEQAISGIVKLYEMRMGYKIKPSSMIFRDVTSKYKESISKAYAIGMIEDINPQQEISYEKLCKWLINAGF